MSRKMILIELNYDIYNKMLFVIIAAFWILKKYIKKTLEIKVFINYKNLVNFCIIK